MDMHPNHHRFVTTYELYEPEDMFAALDALDPSLRDEAMGSTYLHVVGLSPDLDHRRASWEEWREYYSYERFKSRFRELTDRQSVIDYFLVRAALFEVLLQLFHQENPHRPTLPPGHLEGLRDRVSQEQAKATHPVVREVNRTVLDLVDDLLEMRKEPRPTPSQKYHQFCEVALGTLFRRVDSR
jgi:hypothetical protein